jgi:hypothetical protein
MSSELKSGAEDVSDMVVKEAEKSLLIRVELS